MTLQENFKNYLIKQGYKVLTPSGNKSTVHQYVYLVEKTCEEEQISIIELAQNINKFVKLYDKGGSKEGLGLIGHKTWINALKAFQKFVQNKNL